MRWLYAGPARPEEREYLQTTSARIDAWWREFAAKTSGLDACFRGVREAPSAVEGPT